MQVLVTGATGFLGRKVVSELLARHHQVRCLVHSPGKERMLDQSNVDIQYGNVSDIDSIAQAMFDVQSVVHLVGIIRPGRRATFDRVHRQGTSNVVEAAKSGGAREVIYVSALGATDNPAFPYLHSKYQAELRVVSSELGYTILRPSVIYGPGDEFMTALAGLVRLGPVVPVIGAGRNRMQPVAVDDVAHCIAASVGNSLVKGKVLELAGPHRLSYNELLDEVALAMDRRIRRVHIPTAAAWPAVALTQGLLPRPPLTTGQLRMMGIRNVSEGHDIEEAFGFTPRPLRGNIDYVNQVTFGDAFRMTMGLGMPRRS